MRHAANDNDDLTFQPIGLAAKKLVSKLVKSRKLSEVQDGATVVSDGGIRGIDERSEVNTATALHEPSGVGASTVEIDTLKSANGGKGALVGIVLLAGGLTQVSEGVVTAASIDMVDQVCRPLSGAVEPSQPGSPEKLAVDTDDRVAGHSADAPGTLAPVLGSHSVRPGEDASGGVIMQDLAQPLQSYPIVEFMRHPSAPVHKDEGQSERSPESNREKNSEDDAGRELALINFRIEALNWIEFYLSKKRAIANDSQVLLCAGSGGASITN